MNIISDEFVKLKGRVLMPFEMKDQPRELFEPGVEFHPDEHPLPLFAEHVFSLDEALSAAGDRPQRIVRPPTTSPAFPAP